MPPTRARDIGGVSHIQPKTMSLHSAFLLCIAAEKVSHICCNILKTGSGIFSCDLKENKVHYYRDFYQLLLLQQKMLNQDIKIATLLVAQIS